MIQYSEIVTLSFALIGMAVLLPLARDLETRGVAYLRAGFVVLLLSYVFTILEGFVWHDGFNLLEHLGYGGAGLLFATFAHLELRRDGERHGSDA